MDVDASRSNKTAEVGAMRKMLDRTEERFGVKPDWIAADTAYGSADNLVWLALKRQILPFIPVFDKGESVNGGVKAFQWGGSKEGQFGLRALERVAFK